MRKEGIFSVITLERIIHGAFSRHNNSLVHPKPTQQPCSGALD